MIRLLPHGEGGITVELGDAIDQAVNARVHAVARAVARRLRGEVLEVVPSYASLLVIFDPLAVRRAALARRLEALAREVAGAVAEPPRRVVRVPVCYGGAWGPDLGEVARLTGLSPEEVVARHAAPVYRVYLLGFTPGFPYLGGLDPRLACPRMDSPRLQTPAGSVALAGLQTGIYPVESPGGWRVLGRTPLRLFDPSPGATRPFLLAAGDGLRFVPVGREEYDREACTTAQGVAPRAEAKPDEASPERAVGGSGGPEPRALGRRARAPREDGPVIEVVRPGLLCTVQDAGRPGWRAFGMPVAGAMDRLALAAANLLAGNDPGAAAVELTLAGGTWRFETPALAALAGADLSATLDGAPLPPWSSFLAPAGSTLAFGGARAGVRAYLAVRGGIAVPQVLGSRSTYTRAAVGGVEGRALRAGDRLPVGRPAGREPPPLALEPGEVPPCGGGARLRVLLGPQQDRFTEEGLATFLGTAWKVTPQNDRMGYRFEGPPVRLRAAADILTDPLVPGAVQVTGNGLPIAMMMDCHTTGGYAKIATIIGADLRRLAQARAGDEIRFAACRQSDAVAALRAERAWLDGLARRIGRGSRENRRRRRAR